MRTIGVEELRKLELDILDFFVDICNKHHLTYFLSGGTLLGAIRHNGFIPWDDDIDVMMPRKDYDELIRVFPQHDYYKFVYYGNTHNYPKPFGTINDMRTAKPERYLRKKCQNILGVNVDVFPIDSLPETPEEIHKYYIELSKMARKTYCITYSYRVKKSLGFTIKKFSGIFIYRCLDMLGVTSIDRLVIDYARLAQKYNNKETSMCGVTTINNYGEREANVRAEYLPIQVSLFEGKEYCVPANYDAYLKGLYGNYMQLPPKEKQIPHHDVCYWKD